MSRTELTGPVLDRLNLVRWAVVATRLWSPSLSFFYLALVLRTGRGRDRGGGWGGRERERTLAFFGPLTFSPGTAALMMSSEMRW